jgi:hypothetical protein
VSTLGFEPQTLSANNKRAKPLAHVAAHKTDYLIFVDMEFENNTNWN